MASAREKEAKLVDAKLPTLVEEKKVKFRSFRLFSPSIRSLIAAQYMSSDRRGTISTPSILR
jgi:hypothetical protein